MKMIDGRELNGANCFFGRDSVEVLPELLAQLGAGSVFLVTGNESYEKCGARDALERLLASGDGGVPEVPGVPELPGIKADRFYDFSTNPNLDDLRRGIAQFRKGVFQAVLAIGGGSVIDMAKLINIFSFQEDDDVVNYLNGRSALTHKCLPLIAIPTTAGTGSEATRFAVLYYRGVKYSVDSDAMLPRYTILDPSFLHNTPPQVAAAAGIDALAQAIEAYWSVNSTAESAHYSRQAIKLLYDNLEKAVCALNDSVPGNGVPDAEAQDNGLPDAEALDKRVPDEEITDAEALENMLKGAHLAGKAINITFTTGPHAVSYIITSTYNIPHGHAVGLTLGDFLVFNEKVRKDDCNDPRGAEHVKKVIKEIISMCGVQDAYSFRAEWAKLMNAVGLSVRIRDFGIREEDVNYILQNINYSRMKNNPRHITSMEQLKDFAVFRGVL